MSKGSPKDSVNENSKFVITSKGSLGLLAYGDIGLREWRKVKRNTSNKES